MRRAWAALRWIVRAWFLLLPFYAFVVSFASTEKATLIIALCILYHVMENGPREP